MPNKENLLLVGGGIVGLATAYKMLLAYPRVGVCVLEKEEEVGMHQSSHNSGVLHAGLYYKPGSLKAHLAVSGIKEMVRFCARFNIDHEVCGKLVVATCGQEEPRLRELLERGRRNGLKGLRLLGRSEMLEIEPHVGGLSALRVPEEGIVDYPAVCKSLAEQVEKLGGRIVTRARVVGLHEKNSEWTAATTAGDFRGDYLVNCAGLYSDRVSQLAGERREIRIVPFRGEFFKLKAERRYLVKNLIYPVNDPKYPFLGVHCTRLIHGGIEVGPNAVLAFAREGYSKADVNVAELLDALAFPGFWKFILAHPGMCARELGLSFSKDRFCRALQKLVPELQPEDLEAGHSGVRAQAMSPAGQLLQDFSIRERPRALHLLNAPSPAATAALAIGQEVAARAGRLFQLKS